MSVNRRKHFCSNTLVAFQMLTKKLLAGPVGIKESSCTFKSSYSFPKGVLPTKRDILRELLHERTWRTRSVAITVVAA